MNLKDIEYLVHNGESESVEFKKSTAQLRRGAETLCGMLNANGGKVIFGVSKNGNILGQNISDKTLREVAEVLRKFEPTSNIHQERVAISKDKDILILSGEPHPESRPYTFDGKPYKRIGPTTSQMPQESYNRLLRERDNGRYRWEMQKAERYKISDFDTEEILKTVRLGIESGRLPESTGKNIADILERFGLTENGRPLSSAVVLFGKKFLPDYPQCQLRMARFRGIDKSEFIDQKQIEGHAFHLLEEAMTDATAKNHL